MFVGIVHLYDAIIVKSDVCTLQRDIFNLEGCPTDVVKDNHPDNASSTQRT